MRTPSVCHGSFIIWGRLLLAVTIRLPLVSLMLSPIPGSSTSAMTIECPRRACKEDLKVIGSNGYLVGLLHDVAAQSPGLFSERSPSECTYSALHSVLDAEALSGTCSSAKSFTVCPSFSASFQLLPLFDSHSHHAPHLELPDFLCCSSTLGSVRIFGQCCLLAAGALCSLGSLLSILQF